MAVLAPWVEALPAVGKCDKACLRAMKAEVEKAEADVGTDGLTTPAGLLRRRGALSGCRQVPSCRLLRDAAIKASAGQRSP